VAEHIKHKPKDQTMAKLSIKAIKDASGFEPTPEELQRIISLISSYNKEPRDKLVNFAALSTVVIERAAGIGDVLNRAERAEQHIALLEDTVYQLKRICHEYGIELPCPFQKRVFH
jgi:hypothetical protein